VQPWEGGSHESLALKGRDFMTPLQGLDLCWTSNPGFHPGLSHVAPLGRMPSQRQTSPAYGMPTIGREIATVHGERSVQK
jgi:hypothetical protein